MRIENIDIQATIEKVQRLIREDKMMLAATKSMFEILILIITLLANRLNLNSTNSSKPLGIPISEGTIFNFNKEAYKQLAEFETIAKNALAVVLPGEKMSRTEEFVMGNMAVKLLREFDCPVLTVY